MQESALAVVNLCSLILLYKIVTGVFNYVQKQEQYRKEQAFSLYVTTGRKDPAFYRLSHRAMQTAQRQRIRLIREKARNNSTFYAYTECPKCCDFDVHYLSKNFLRQSARTCNKCTFTWRQK